MVRRSTRQANEPEITHPLHAARTAELRAQATRVRAREGIGGGGAGPGKARRTHPIGTTVTMVMWTSDGVRTVAGSGGGCGGRARGPEGLTRTSAGGVTEEEFPSLGPSSSSGRVSYLERMRTQPTTTAGATAAPRPDRRRRRLLRHLRGRRRRAHPPPPDTPSRPPSRLYRRHARRIGAQSDKRRQFLIPGRRRVLVVVCRDGHAVQSVRGCSGPRAQAE